MATSTMETMQFTVGRSDGCDLRINHPSISRAHVKILCSGDDVLLEDLNSQDGTFVFHKGEFKRVRSAKIKLDTVIRLGGALQGMEVGKLIDDFKREKEIARKDISKHKKVARLKRCFDCGEVVAKETIYCDTCGAIFEECA